MTWFITKRVGQALVVLVVVVTAVFFFGRIVGDPVALFVSLDATEEEIAAIEAQLGLDKSLPAQYASFVRDLVRGDLGDSLLLRSYGVDELLGPAFLNSLKLGSAALGIGLFFGLPLGILAGVNRGTPLDFVARTVALVGQVVPGWWLGIVLIVLLSAQWDLLPPAGVGGISHYVMPAGTVGLFLVAGITRLTRSSMIEILDSEYIKMARAKGLARNSVLWKHALKNALIPVVTYGGLYFAFLITGTVVIEVVFAWPGLGRLMFDALSKRDFPVMQGAVLLTASLIMAVNMLVDIAYGWIDPRIRYQ